jgi:hypothetical protein
MGTEVNISVTKKQKMFLKATATEVLFGGAAGGGKSYGQTVDAFLFALKYPGSKQLLLRRTFAELDKSLIRTVQGWYPREIFSYNSSAHVGKFSNGSVIDFGYCASESDVTQYQSAEYDVIRFDELTHFTEYQYVWLISRIRGSNGFPKQIKCSTNPGGVGHTWVKERFVDPAPPNTEFIGADGMSRIFIPSLLSDNTFLMASDPDYQKRLEALPEAEKRALLYGDWNIFEGQYFGEFDQRYHVCDPIPIPREWRRYRTIDYGLDMFAAYWIAVDNSNNCYVYREYCQSDLPISSAAKEMIDRTDPDEDIYCTLAPPDLWNRSQETGKSKALLFGEAGLSLVKSNNDREAGWLAIKELLKVNDAGEARLHIFSTCRRLIKDLPALQRDDKRPTDVSNEPHDITHAPDSLRYFAIYWTRPNAEQVAEKKVKYPPDMQADYRRASADIKAKIEKKMGGKPLW